MFFTNALQDYIQQLYDFSYILNNDLTFWVFFKQLLISLISSIKFVLIYIISFNWLKDFVELPCTFRESYSAIFEGTNIFETILATQLDPSFVSFGSLQPMSTNRFGTGLLNSFFLTLPLSVAHLLTIRVFLLNGIPAALCAAAGTILGQFLFLTCILLGFESILIPFMNYQPFIYISTLVILVNLVYYIAHFPTIYGINKTQKTILIPLFGLNFILAWTENTSIFQYFSNVTINGSSTVLQNSNPSTGANVLYLGGLLLGTIIWSFVFAKLVVGFRNWVSSIFSLPFTYLNEKIHSLTLVMLCIFSLTSIPYYGFEYFLARPLGFLSQDSNLPSSKSGPIFTGQKVAPALTLNVSSFDRSDGLKHLTSCYEDFSFEPFNYWNNRTTMYMSFASSNFKVGKLPELSMGTEEVKVREDANLIKELYDDSEFRDPETKELIEAPEIDILEKRVDLIAQKLFKSSNYNYFKETSSTKTNLLIEFQQFFKKYYNNPIYKALTQLEINSFLVGQPNSQGLTAMDETDLYNRRLVFEHYLESIEEYKLNSLVDKAIFSENIYNQQFKGTFDLVSQYFSIEVPSNLLRLNDPTYAEGIMDIDDLLDPDETLDTEEVLDLEEVLDTEEVLDMDELIDPDEALDIDELIDPDEALDIDEVLEEKTFPLQIAKFEKPQTLLKYDRVLFNEMGLQLNLLLHDELQGRLSELKEMDVSASIPFYIGWDNSISKFLVKSPYIQTDTGVTTIRNLDSNSSLDNNNTKPTILFSMTTWPIDKMMTSNHEAEGVVIPVTELSSKIRQDLVNFINDKLEFEPDFNVERNTPFNLPVYNWDTLSPEDIESLQTRFDKGSLKIGNTLPPRFGGFYLDGKTSFVLEQAPNISFKGIIDKLNFPIKIF